MFENLQPIGKRILVRIIEHEEKSSGGIILTTMTQEKSYRMGNVVAVGEGLEISVQVGDSILLTKYAGTPLGSDLLMVFQDEVLAKV
jgi:chaperonin GroES